MPPIWCVSAINNTQVAFSLWIEASFVVARPKQDTIENSGVSITRLIRAVPASAILRKRRLADPNNCEYRNGPPFARPFNQPGNEFLHALRSHCRSNMSALPMIL